MTETKEPTLVRLTAEQMAHLKHLTETEERPSEAVLVQTWRYLLGDETWEALPDKALRPWEWAIPHAQWEEICGYLLTAADRWSDVNRVNFALDFVNVGPAAK